MKPESRRNGTQWNTMLKSSENGEVEKLRQELGLSKADFILKLVREFNHSSDEDFKEGTK